MAKCPSCGTEGAYYGLTRVDCLNTRCFHHKLGRSVTESAQKSVRIKPKLSEGETGRATKRKEMLERAQKCIDLSKKFRPNMTDNEIENMASDLMHMPQWALDSLDKRLDKVDKK